MLKRFIWTLTLVALAGVASAQGDFFHRPSPLAGRTLLTLSLFDEVRTELKTTPEVNGKEDDLLTKLQPEIGEAVQGGNGDFASIRPLIDKVNAKYDDEVIKLLSADQVTRLKQLFVQYNGNSSVTTPVIAKDLGITDDQKKQIDKIQADQAPKMMEAFQSGAEAMKKLRDEFAANVEKVLTDDQKKKLKDMAGTKFEFKKEAG